MKKMMIQTIYNSSNNVHHGHRYHPSSTNTTNPTTKRPACRIQQTHYLCSPLDLQTVKHTFRILYVILILQIMGIFLIDYYPYPVFASNIPSSIPRSIHYSSTTNSPFHHDDDDDDHDQQRSQDSTTNQNKRHRWTIHNNNHHKKNILLWNPSSKIDSHGFITGTFKRIPGDWEVSTNLPGKYGPTSKHFHSLLSSSTFIRQVPGDGNCLFHSITVALCAIVNQTHIDMSTTTANTRRRTRRRNKRKNTRTSKKKIVTKDEQNYPTTTSFLSSRQRHTRHESIKFTELDSKSLLNHIKDTMDPEEEEEEEEEEEKQYDWEWNPDNVEGEEMDNDNTDDNSYRNSHYHPSSSSLDLQHLYTYSRYLRHEAVKALSSKTHRLLFLQGNEYLRASDLVEAAAAQYDITGEEYCNLMRKDSYWGGGPEIVALCNVLKRPIHVYELCSTPSSSSSSTNTWTEKNNPNEIVRGREEKKEEEDELLILQDSTSTTDVHSDRSSSSSSYLDSTTDAITEFRLRRMACFGSPKFDRKEPLHILSADSRFPDIEPGKQNSSGNHFLVLFPQEYIISMLDHAQKVQRRKRKQEHQRGQRKDHKKRRVRGGARDYHSLSSNNDFGLKREEEKKRRNQKNRKRNRSEQNVYRKISNENRNLLGKVLSMLKNMYNKLY